MTYKPIAYRVRDAYRRQLNNDPRSDYQLLCEAYRDFKGKGKELLGGLETRLRRSRP